MSLGLAVGGMAVPLVGWAMQTYGWRTTALGFRHHGHGGRPAAGAHVAAQPGRDRRDRWTACRRAGARAHSAAARLPAAPRAASPRREALRTRAFWLLGLGHGFALLVVTAVNVHAISHMKEGLGYSLAQASLVITLMTLSQALRRAARAPRWATAGTSGDVAAGCMLAHMLGLLMLTFAAHPAMLGAFAVLHGVAWGLRGPFMQAMRADYFGLQAIGMILGLSAIIIVARPGGRADDRRRASPTSPATTATGFTLLALVAGSGSVLFLLARKPA